MTKKQVFSIFLEKESNTYGWEFGDELFEDADLITLIGILEKVKSEVIRISEIEEGEEPEDEPESTKPTNTSTKE